MSVYEKYCLPHFLHFACGLKVIQDQRKKIVPLAQGCVLEIVIGDACSCQDQADDQATMERIN